MSLVSGFVLTKNIEGKSSRTVEYYRENLGRFLWYASKQKWSDDVRFLTEWQIREFLNYVKTEMVLIRSAILLRITPGQWWRLMIMMRLPRH
jgi:hypothetical protein